MTAHINNVLKQAITTFTAKQDLFHANLQILSSLLDRITASDVGFNPQFSTEEFWNKPHKAPASCIDIYEDSNVTLVIFILKPDGQLPLHNHPEMYGLIKVISGKVNITSYSLNTEKTAEVDKDMNSAINLTLKKIITAELNSSEILDSNSRPCMLEPNTNNLHEIKSIDGPAAFLDILAPPYGTTMKNNGPRLCSFYSILSQPSPNVYRLQEVQLPSNYWSDAFPYTGPKLDI